MNHSVPPNRRVLLVDDNPAIHDDFRRVLTLPASSGNDLDLEAEALFGELPSESFAAGVNSVPQFVLDSALQGQEALEKVSAAREAGQPYALAFVDMRMPPGWDGLTTITKLWEVDPELQVVICTAYSDRSWGEIQTTLTARDRWLVLKKPFDKVELLQLAQALTEKWHLAQLARHREQLLESAVDARTEQLRRAIQVKNEFLANVSHELLTPMNGLIGLQTLLAETDLDESQQELLVDSRLCADDLMRLLQEILTFNQAEAGKLDLTPVPFSPETLAREVVETYSSRASLKGISMNVRMQPGGSNEVCAPAGVVRDLLCALVDNAVKFTKAGEVSVEIHSEGRRLRFSVQDTGVGLSAEQLEWITLPFAKVDGGNARRFGGIGLGLAVARRLATALGGELDVSSEPGKGTRVSFSALMATDCGIQSLA